MTLWIVETFIATSVLMLVVLAIRVPVAPDEAIGIIGKTIIVPHDFATRFDAVEQRLALAHELAHRHCGQHATTLHCNSLH